MANEANATRQAASDGEAGVHRLRDIVVEEVSLVDRAANKRRFLVVKRGGDAPAEDADAPKAEDQPDSGVRRGASSKQPKTKPGKAVDKARRRRAPAASDDEALGKAGRSKPPWVKDDEDDDVEANKADDTPEEDDDDEGEEEGVEANKAASEDDDEEEDDEDDDSGGPAADRRRGGKPAAKAGDAVVIPAGVKTALLRVLAQALERLMGVANRIKEADEPDDDTDASVPDDLEEELESVGELLEDVAERLPTSKAAGSKTGVAKAGRRMAKERLDRFQKALALLSDVLKELVGDQKAAEQNGGAGKTKAKKQADSPGLDDLVASVGELTQLVKRQQEEITSVRKTRATSNAISVDGARPRPSQDVSWPLDMNRPISRDTVSKSVSFYED